MSMLRTEDLKVHYGAVQAVNGVDLEVDRRSLHGLIGPNGAGKSSFINAVSGRTPPTAGRVWFDGEDITDRSVQWRRRNGLARSFQRTSVFPTLTVRNQLELVAEHVGEPDLGEIIEHLELGELLDEPCGVIAYGDQRRVDLALALLGEPPMLLLDEPAAGLTAQETQRLVAHIQQLAEERELTLVLVEHDVEAVFACCDVVSVLDRGEILMTGSPEEVRTNKEVIEAYLGSTA